jgi:hypothetical protein
MVSGRGKKNGGRGKEARSARVFFALKDPFKIGIRGTGHIRETCFIAMAAGIDDAVPWIIR